MSTESRPTNSLSPDEATIQTNSLANSDLSSQPVSAQNRESILDFVRGIAIFGILIMNIQTFGHVFSSYFNPTMSEDFEGVNVLAWMMSHIFFEQKFYTIFSMLFGAGIVLMAQKARDSGKSAAGLHYRRTLLLIAFGLSHGFFIWYGDILTTYGFCALFVYLGWQASPTRLIVVGIILSLLVSLMMLLGSTSMPSDQIEIMQQGFRPDQSLIAEEIAAYLGSWSENQAARVTQMQLMISFMIFGGVRIAGCMLLGMAIYKLGILNGKRTVKYYRNMTFICLIPSLPIIFWGATMMSESGFKDAVLIQMVYGQINFILSIVVALGYIALFNWIYLSVKKGQLIERIEAVGQMAFTNYITQSMICTTIFYGFGFGLFASLERYQLLGVALLVLMMQFTWSKWWLQRFYFGPLEWLWRSLTYMAPQKFKRPQL